jgi:hypothetical protein
MHVQLSQTEPRDIKLVFPEFTLFQVISVIGSEPLPRNRVVEIPPHRIYLVNISKVFLEIAKV